MSQHVDSTIIQFEKALSAFASEMNNPARFAALADLLAPSLFKGQSAFFNHACAHASTARGGELLPALMAFMDRLTRGGDAVVEQGPPLAWRSAALLAEVHPEEDFDDPRFIEGTEALAADLARLFRVAPPMVSIAPLLIDLRSAKPGFDLFQCAMLPTQWQAIGAARLAEANPSVSSAPTHEAPSLWKALMVSIAFDPKIAPDRLADLLGAALGAGPEAYARYKIGARESTCLLAIKAAADPFSCCAFALDPEKRALESDLARLLQAFPNANSLNAMIEPAIAKSALPELVGPGEQAPLESIRLAICDNQARFLDALSFPPIPESIALIHALLERAGIAHAMMPPTRLSRDAQGRLLWCTPMGLIPYDVNVWRVAVLGADPIDMSEELA